MKTELDTKERTWEKTKHQNLLRHKSGRYYARLFSRGKEIWKSLKTNSFSVAEARLAALQKEHRERSAQITETGNAKMSFLVAAQLHMTNLAENISLKPATQKYWKDTLLALRKSWPALDGLEIRKISPAICSQWATGYAKSTSSSRYNNSLALLKHILDVAIQEGVIYANPAVGLPRKKVTSKHLDLPTLAKFNEFIHEMRKAHSRDSQNCADLAQGLAYTGCRIAESAQIEWGDVDFERGEITVKGDPETGTKNWEIRRVPMIPEARVLLTRLRNEQTPIPTAKVFQVKECQKSMDRAAKRVGITRITHHDLRHFSPQFVSKVALTSQRCRAGWAIRTAGLWP